MTLRLTDEEVRALRRRAEQEHCRCKRSPGRRSEYIEGHSRTDLVDKVLDLRAAALRGGTAATRSAIDLTLADLLHVAERTLDGEVVLRDVGLLEAAAARPQASAFGEDAYPTLPFVVDSVNALLARDGYEVHLLLHPGGGRRVAGARRDQP